ncbi:MAG: uridine kinase [Bdellovibrionaceae bacterium]|nr:uridine kinase [Pseudobdellovibrionaceae bacterium]
MRVTGFTTQNRPLLIGISGGSGSGKTYFARALAEKLGAKNCTVIYQDHFYKDQSAHFDFDGGSVNFDHPDAIDFKLFAQCLTDLRAGRDVRIPHYDFKTHSRIGDGQPLAVHPVIIADGTLIFHYPEVRALFDLRVFLDTPEELRFSRRLDRDVRERGRTPEGVRSQFETQVKPMHDLFVAPCRAYTEQVIEKPEDFARVLDFCVKSAGPYLTA